LDAANTKKNGEAMTAIARIVRNQTEGFHARHDEAHTKTKASRVSSGNKIFRPLAQVIARDGNPDKGESVDNK
jgi:hypothetical protein